MPAYPLSDHFDGERFFNPHGPSARAFSDLPKWWWERARGSIVAWPKTLPPVAPVELPSAIGAREVAATFIGHATWLLQFTDFNVLTDPVFSNRAGPFGLLGPRRAQPAALRLGQLPRIDVVVVSHNHYDHLDLASLRWLSRQRHPVVVVPLGLKAWLEARGVTGVVELDWWQGQSLRAGLAVTCTPAQHWSSRWPWDRCETLWGGFMLSTDAGRIYFAGDTGWGPHFGEVGRRLGPPDVALLPIGAYEPRWFMEPVHMNPAEAVRAHLALGARRSLGMHHETWQLTDEGFDAPRRALETARHEAGLAPEGFAVPAVGQTFRLAAG